MSDVDDQFVRNVAELAGRELLARAKDVRYPDRYVQACAKRIITDERERILRWRSEFDVRPIDMARALADGQVPRWWTGQHLSQPDVAVHSAEVIDLSARRRKAH